MNLETISPSIVSSSFRAKVKISFKVGYFSIKTLNSADELLSAFSLRHHVFQVGDANHYDHDMFDDGADHLAIFDDRTGFMVATCRLNSSRFVSRFYSEQEFQCRELIDRPEVKLEIGRVCVHPDFQRGVVIMMLWRAIGEYLTKTESEVLFGCGSVMTQDAHEAWILTRYLESEQILRTPHTVYPTEEFRFKGLEEELIWQRGRSLTDTEVSKAKNLLPSLCQSYFDLGCYVPGIPAIDTEFQCIDFLTVLEMKDLSPRVRKKILGQA